MSGNVTLIFDKLNGLKQDYAGVENRVSELETYKVVQDEKNIENEKNHSIIREDIKEVKGDVKFIRNWMVFTTGGGILIAAIALILNISGVL